MNDSPLRGSYPSLQELGQSYRELYRALGGASDHVNQIKAMIGDPAVSSNDSWLIRAGIALIAFPDPTISDMIGLAMVAAGLVKRRIRRLTVADMNRELQDMIKRIDGLR